MIQVVFSVCAESCKISDGVDSYISY